MRRMLSVMGLAALLLARHAGAFDATGANVIGLRLGMAEADVIAELTRQGFRVVRDIGGLTAITRDGTLTVDLAKGLGARQIRYVFRARVAGEQERIGESLIDRYGVPDQVEPMTWCGAAVARGARCPEDHASLAFQPETLTLLLRSARP